MQLGHNPMESAPGRLPSLSVMPSMCVMAVAARWSFLGFPLRWIILASAHPYGSCNIDFEEALSISDF